MTDASSNGTRPSVEEPFVVRNDLHFIPRIALPRPRDPVIGITTTEDGGW